MWNQKIVVPPLVCNMKTNITAKNKGHFKNMKTMMANLTHLLSDVTVWRSEQYVLSKLVYKNHSQRRREKTLQGLKRIKSCVERFCALEDIKYLRDITSSLESVDLDDDNTYLPSRQMLQYVLVKLMGVAALLTQTCAYCVHNFLTVQQDLEIGIFIPQSMVFLSVISRIWALSKSTCIYMVQWYNTLHKCLEHLEPTQVVWLEDPDILPVCIRKWLEQFNRKTLPTERATAEMTELAKPCADQKLVTGSPAQQVTTQGFVNDDKEAESILTAGLEESSDDSEGMDEDLGCSISRDDLSSKQITKNKKKKMHVVQDQMRKLVVNQAIEKLELVETLEDLLQLVLRTDCQNSEGLHRKKCVGRLQKLMVISKTKKHKNPAKFVIRGKLCVKKFLLLNVGTESGVVQQDGSSHKQLRIVKLEELQTQQDIKNLLVNFRRNNSIYLQGRCVKIDDQKSARRIRVALKQCMSKMKNSDTTKPKQAISKAVKAVTSVVEQIERDTPDISESQANESIWESKQVENTPCKVISMKKDKNVRLEDTFRTTAKARKEKKKGKKKVSDAKTKDIRTPANVASLKRKISAEGQDIIPEKKKTKTSGTKKQNLKLSTRRKNKRVGKGKAKTK